MAGIITQGRKNRGGRYQLFKLDLLWKPYTLNFIRNNFDYDWFSIADFLDKKIWRYSLRYDRDNENVWRVRLLRLHRLFWLFRKKEGKTIYFKLSNKAHDYEHRNARFTEGPLVEGCIKRLKGKEQGKITEKEILKEIKESEKEDVVGFV